MRQSDTPTIQERFEEFHKKNPHVYERLVDLSIDAALKGHTKIGIDLLFCVLRWESMMKTDDPSSDFKLNDHYRSRYARLIMSEEPLLDGIFDVRELTAR